MKLYDFSDSGNGYKVRLALAQLGLAYEFEEVNILRGESRTPEFLQRNPNGRVPVLELDDGQFLSESAAILFYLADGSELLPDDLRDAVAEAIFFQRPVFWRKNTLGQCRFMPGEPFWLPGTAEGSTLRLNFSYSTDEEDEVGVAKVAQLLRDYSLA